MYLYTVACIIYMYAAKCYTKFTISRKDFVHKFDLFIYGLLKNNSDKAAGGPKTVKFTG